MKETLTCSSCRKDWKREKARGRKPVLCPKCAKNVVNEKKNSAPVAVEPIKHVSQSVLNDDITVKNIISKVYRDYYPDNKDLVESTKNGSHWHCVKCKQELVSHLPLCDIPTHRCPPQSTIIRPYERLS